MLDFRGGPVESPTHAMKAMGMGKIHVLKPGGTETLCGRGVDEHGLARGRVVAGETEGHSAACSRCQQIKDG